jgi:hypothetical protein
VLGIEYDHRDFGALSGLFLARLDANLGVVWCRHLDVPNRWLEQASLREVAPGDVAVRRHRAEQRRRRADAGEAFFARIDVVAGGLLARRGPDRRGTPRVARIDATAAFFFKAKRMVRRRIAAQCPSITISRSICSGDTVRRIRRFRRCICVRGRRYFLALGAMSDEDGFVYE